MDAKPFEPSGMLVSNDEELRKQWSAHVVACGLRPECYGELSKAKKAEHLRFGTDLSRVDRPEHGPEAPPAEATFAGYFGNGQGQRS